MLEVPPLLRGSVQICSLGGTPNPRLEGFGGMGTQIWFVGLEPKLGFCTQRCGAKTMTRFGHLAHGGHRASLKEQGAISSIMRCLVKMEKIFFECVVWACATKVKSI